MLSGLLAHGDLRIQQQDPALYQLLSDELTRQQSVLSLVASSSIAGPSRFQLELELQIHVRTEVAELCRRFPIPGYGTSI